MMSGEPAQQVVAMAAPQSISTAGVPKLVGTNFASWKEMVMIVLKLKGIAKAIREDNVDEIQDLQAKLVLYETMDESHRSQVRGCETAKKILERLELVYADTSAANVYRLLHNYYRYNKSPSDSMSVHLGKMDELRNQLADLGQKQSEEVYQVTLIGSLPPEYGSIMEVWELTHKDMRTTPNLVARLLKREEDLKQSGDVSHALVTKADRNPEWDSLPIEEKKKRSKCANCGEKGHWFRECTKPKKKEKAGDKQSGKRERAFAASAMKEKDVSSDEESDASETCFKVGLGNDKLKLKWLSDSAATSHFCNQLKWFVDFQVQDGTKTVEGCDGTPLPILGIGSVRIVAETSQGEVVSKLTGVNYCPGLTTNLIYVGSAADHGVTTTYVKDKCIMKMKGKVIAQGERLTSRLYILKIKVVEPGVESAYLVGANKTLMDYHKALGHASREKIINLLKHSGINVADADQELQCVICAQSKAKRVPHPTRESEDKLGSLHVDLSGIVNKDSELEIKYYMLAKDKTSGYSFSYRCKNKAEVPKLLAQLFIDFENVAGYPATELHSDNGTEFKNKAVEIICLKERVKQFFSSPRCPQQN